MRNKDAMILLGAGALVYFATRPKVSGVSGIPIEHMPPNGFGGSAYDSVNGVASFKTHRGPGGSFGCTIGITPELGVVGYGRTPEDALHTTAAVASGISDALNEHPELVAILPGGPALPAALKGIALASQAVKEGHSMDVVAKKIGPATARLVDKLISLF